jgi:hypothetical protein
LVGDHLSCGIESAVALALRWDACRSWPAEALSDCCRVDHGRTASSCVVMFVTRYDEKLAMIRDAESPGNSV